VSGANNTATVSGANNTATVSGANNTAPVSGANDEKAAEVSEDQKHEPLIQVLKGNPSDEELAAVVAVLAAAAGKPEPLREQERNLWGHPVDRLRYTPYSWQRVTLVERTHMRRR